MSNCGLILYRFFMACKGGVIAGLIGEAAGCITGHSVRVLTPFPHRIGGIIRPGTLVA